MLSSMAARLGHRHTGEVKYLHGVDCHVAWAPDACSNSLCGAVGSDESGFIALSGIPRHPSARSIEELLQIAQEEGIKFLDELGGPFVGILYHSGKCYLFRDKAGRRTMYLTEIGGSICFAIESRVLYSLPGFSPEILPASLAQYLAFSYVPGGNTMLRGIREIPAGCYIEARSPDTAVRYFFPERLENSASERTDREWIGVFDQSFRRCIDHLPAPSSNRAVFLSGGIDSSMVTDALAEKYGFSSLKAFAIHFGKDYPNELPWIREMAKHCNVECEEVEVNPKMFVPSLEEIVSSLNDPIGDPVAMPNYQLARHVAGQGFEAVYNGEGGDPLFGGPKNMTMLLHHWYGQPREKNHREKGYLSSYRRGYEELHYLLTPDYRRQIDEETDLEGILSRHFGAGPPESFLKKLLLINMRLKGAHLILPKVERMLGAHGLTPLSPLFDEELIELCMALPGHLLLQNGIEKWIFKEAYRDRLPDSIINRPKSGMRVPVHYWFRGEMKRYARHILLDRKVKNAGIFDHRRIRKLLNYDTDEGPGRYGIRLWMLLTFELWRREVFGG